MIKPGSLKKGDTVAIVAPGRKIKNELIESSIKIIEHWGLRVILSKNLFSNKHTYLAGTDQERIEDFQDALDNSEVKAIICARGGYGSTRILDQLNFTAFEKRPKWIVGFSDITAFHLKLFTIGVESIHATMPVLFAKQGSEASVESLHDILFGKDVILTAKSHNANRYGQAVNQVVGGNLSLLVDSIGTPNEPHTTNKILIIEEIDEYFYKVDRMFTQLKRAGKLEGLAGLVIGHFTDIKDSELGFGESVEQIIMNAVKQFDFPVAFGFSTGHENPNFAWLSGGLAKLEVSSQGASLAFKPTALNQVNN